MLWTRLILRGSSNSVTLILKGRYRLLRTARQNWSSLLFPTHEPITNLPYSSWLTVLPLAEYPCCLMKSYLFHKVSLTFLSTYCCELLSPRTQNSVRNHRGTHKSLHYVAAIHYIHCQICQRFQRKMEALLYCQTITSLVVTLAEALTVYLLKISAPPRAFQDRMSLCSPWLSWHSLCEPGWY